MLDGVKLLHPDTSKIRLCPQCCTKEPLLVTTLLSCTCCLTKVRSFNPNYSVFSLKWSMTLCLWVSKIKHQHFCKALSQSLKSSLLYNCYNCCDNLVFFFMLFDWDQMKSFIPNSSIFSSKWSMALCLWTSMELGIFRSVPGLYTRLA